MLVLSRKINQRILIKVYREALVKILEESAGAEEILLTEICLCDIKQGQAKFGFEDSTGRLTIIREELNGPK